MALLVLASACSGDGAADTASVGGSGSGGSGGSTSGGGASASGGSGGTGGETTGGASGSGSQASAGTAGAPSSDDGASVGFGDLLPRATYETLFPNRDALYDYDSLASAAAKYPDFAAQGTLAERRREVAAFLANIAHETTGGWPTAPGGPEAWGLYFKEELGCETGTCTEYCDASNTEYPCAAGKTYHGRGPIQLTWNYNYGAFGAELGVDLLANPELITSDGALAFETALWFWMTAQPPKPSAHEALLGLWQPGDADRALGRVPGFGMTINIINGGLECGFPLEGRVDDRVRFFRHFVGVLETSEGDNVVCETMMPY